MPSAWRFRFILFLIFTTAFCSYAYELVLAQVLAILWGDVVLQYTVTTGIYIASMGLGAFLTPTKISAEKSFIWIEVGLSLFAVVAPFALVGADIHFREWAGPLSYFFIALIGFLSGMELPLLLRISHESTAEEEKTERALFVDYAGMFFAGILFALLLNRTWGTLKTSLWLAFANLGLALVCALIWGFRFRRIHWIEVPALFVGFAGMAWFVFHYINLYQEQLEKWVIGN